MQFLDVVAVLLVLLAVIAFAVGNAALARAEDIHALYWLIVGVVSLRAGVQLVRPGTA
jgi:hypothetical protein